MRRRSFLAGALAATTVVGVNTTSGKATHSLTAGSGSGAIIVDGSDVSVLNESYLTLLETAGVDVWHYNGPHTLVEISQMYDFLDHHGAQIALVRSGADVAAAKTAGKLALVVGWQDAKALDESAGNEWRYASPPQLSLRAYYELGLRVVNLAYNLGNQFAGGCLDPRMPLTRSGEVLVHRLQERGILVDCGGHTGEQSSLDIIKIAQRPVICSHSNVKASNDNPRCTSDRVIDGIAGTGGVFGVTAIDAFMTWGYKDIHKDPVADIPPQAPLGRFVDEIDYLMHLVGPDHIGLGPDFTQGAAESTIDPDSAFAFPIEMTFKQKGHIRYVRGFENISQIGNVRAELLKRGYTPENIQKILGGNWMRVYREAWGA